MEEIVIEIKDGKARVETSGFVGTACKDATADLERAMGTVVAEDPKPEWHQREVRTVGQ